MFERNLLENFYVGKFFITKKRGVGFSQPAPLKG